LLAIYLDLLRSELQAITALVGVVGLQSHCKCCSNARVGCDFLPRRKNFAPSLVAWGCETGRIFAKRNSFPSSFVRGRFQSSRNMHYKWGASGVDL